MMPAAILRNLRAGIDIHNSHRSDINGEVRIDREGQTRASAGRAAPSLEEDLFESRLGQTFEPGFQSEAGIKVRGTGITKVNGITIKDTILIGIIAGTLIINKDREVTQQLRIRVTGRSAV